MKTTYAYEPMPVTDAGAKEITTVREAFKALDTLISQGEPKDPRLLSIAKTHLETSCMFIVKAITHYQK